jgi:hypothetical protein
MARRLECLRRLGSEWPKAMCGDISQSLSKSISQDSSNGVENNHQRTTRDQLTAIANVAVSFLYH